MLYPSSIRCLDTEQDTAPATMNDFIEVCRGKGRQKKDRNINHDEESLIKHYVRMVSSYKTELCCFGSGKTFGVCPNGKYCFDAHSKSEMRRNPLLPNGGYLYSRISSKNMLNGDKANRLLALNDFEVMYHPNTYKKKMCSYNDRCEWGDYCAFRHDHDILSFELRKKLFPREANDINQSESNTVKPKIDNTFYSKSNENTVDDNVLCLAQDFRLLEAESKVDEDNTMMNEIFALSQPLSVGEDDHAKYDSTSTSSPASSSISIERNCQVSFDLDPNRMRSASIIADLVSRLPPGSHEAVALLQSLSWSSEGIYALDSQGDTGLLHSVKRGLYDFVPYFATQRTIDKLNDKGQTPLSVAIERDDRRMLDELIRFNVNLRETVDGGALVFALKSDSLLCAERLTEILPSIDLSLLDPASGNSALAMAAEHGVESIAALLCDAAPNLINLPNNHGETPLALACRHGHAAATACLLRHNADPNIVDNAHNSPLLLALSADRGRACAEILLEASSLDVDKRNKSDLSPITMARRKGYTDIVSRLLRLGATETEFFREFSLFVDG